jgi:hypothetical protein
MISRGDAIARQCGWTTGRPAGAPVLTIWYTIYNDSQPLVGAKCRSLSD